MSEETKHFKEPKDCPRWEHCVAQLCPLSENSLNVWWSGEEICKLKDLQNMLLIRNQKKISNRRAPGCFTKNMLDRHIIIGKAIKGLV